MQLTTHRRESADRQIRAIDDRTAEAVLEHGPTILRTARRYSVCASDAEDAYQRGIEILLTKAPTTDTAQLVPWLVTVVKNEALAILKQRQRVDGAAFEAGAETMASADRLPDDRAEDYELIAHGAEALGRLKRDEVKALLLKAEGLSYKEIAVHTGWTYTKVNRCITEGRAAFRNRLSAIQTGSECDRLSPLLSRFADDEAGEVEQDDVQRHLQNCLACRSSLREYRAAPARVAALFPVPFLALDNNIAEGGVNAIQIAWHWIQERLAATSVHAHQWGEVAGAKKVATIAAAAALASGGVAIEQKFDAKPEPHVRQAATVQLRPTIVPVRSVREKPRAAKRHVKKGEEAGPAPTSGVEPAPIAVAPAEETQPQLEPELEQAPATSDGTADLAP